MADTRPDDPYVEQELKAGRGTRFVASARVKAYLKEKGFLNCEISSGGDITYKDEKGNTKTRSRKFNPTWIRESAYDAGE
jgi:hypothetical protein